MVAIMLLKKIIKSTRNSLNKLNCQPGLNWTKSQIMFHNDISTRDLYKMTFSNGQFQACNIMLIPCKIQFHLCQLKLQTVKLNRKKIKSKLKSN